MFGRDRLEEHMLEDTDSDMLYQNAMGGFEDEVDMNTQLDLAPMHARTGSSP